MRSGLDVECASQLASPRLRVAAIKSGTGARAGAPKLKPAFRKGKVPRKTSGALRTSRFFRRGFPRLPDAALPPLRPRQMWSSTVDRPPPGHLKHALRVGSQMPSPNCISRALQSSLLRLRLRNTSA